VRAGRRVGEWRGSGDLPNFIRAPWGPGWALVGDAGYRRDPLPAQGISDAFRDAHALTEAIHAGLEGRLSMESAMSDALAVDASFADSLQCAPSHRPSVRRLSGRRNRAP
jgi:flavin-dependent dehydrogenase